MTEVRLSVLPSSVAPALVGMRSCPARCQQR
jgi:hypothetical protein